MGLRINQNIAAMNSYRNLSVTDGQMSKSLEKLSSGFRINRAADDAAGLAISEGLRSQVGGLKVAVRNAQDGVSVVQTAEGALTEMHSILQRMRDLAVQAANGSNNAAARGNLKTEIDSLAAELTRIADTTKFNGTKLLDGSSTALTFQVGASDQCRGEPGRGQPRLCRHRDHGRHDQGARPSPRRPTRSRRSRPSTPRSARSRPRARSSVRSRTGSSTRSTRSTSRWRTCPRRRAGSATPTWRRDDARSPGRRSCRRPAPRCWPRPTRRRRASCVCSSDDAVTRRPTGTSPPRRNRWGR